MTDGHTNLGRAQVIICLSSLIISCPLAAPPSQEATPTPPVDSITDLFSHLSMCTQPVPTVKPLVSMVTNSVVSIYSFIANAYSLTKN